MVEIAGPDITGKVALVTGSSRGIGRAIAQRLASAGATVVVTGRSASTPAAGERWGQDHLVAGTLDEAVALIEAAGGKAIAIAADIEELDVVRALPDLAAQAAGGRLDILVNNAGIETIGFSWDIPDATWDRLLSINVRGVVHGSRIFARRMLAAGKPAYIANVASIGALGMMPTQARYMMSKHAVLSFTECLFLEMRLQQAPIKVSAVLPAQVATRIFDDAPTEPGSAMVDRQRRMMQAMLAVQGLTPVQAGEVILDGIASGDFWVSTHPQTTAHLAKARADYFAALATPALAEEARGLVE